MILYPNSRFLTFLLGLFLLQALVVAQDTVSVERTNNKVILEGTVYYVHVVKPGETLYAISKAYHISQKEIAVENPGVISGLQVGQTLKIPVVPKLSVEIDTSPPESGENGKYHLVKPGETLYGISRLYDLGEEDLMLANPGLSPDNLRPGQRLKIPAPLAAGEEPNFNEEGFIYHTVKRRETLYSIAGYYQVTVDEIRAVNPELGWGGPKTGQVIKIPARQVPDQLNAGDIPGREDDSRLYGDTLVEEEYDFDEEDLGVENRRHIYRVAFFIPFDFSEMEPLDSLTRNVVSESRRNRIVERYLVEERVPQSVQFLEFFEGTLLAIDSMRQSGMKLDVHYFDTRRSMDRTRFILADDALKSFDLFIGPFYSYNLEIVADYARRYRIPVVTPFYNDLDLIGNNPYLFQVNPSLERGYMEAAKLVASKYMYNIVYVRQEDSLDVEKHDYFKQLIFDGLDDYHPSEPVVFKEVIQKLDRTNELIQSLSSDKKNLVVVATADEALASSVVSSLYYQLKEYDIEVLGTPFWPEFSSIDFRYYHELNVMFYSSFWVDYHDPRIERFLSKFRSTFLSEPTVTSMQGINYGILGYDMTFYFLNALRSYGARFIVRLDDYRPGMVQGPFTFSRVSGSGGFENTHFNFYRFAPDMTIKKIEVPELPETNFYFTPLEDRMRRRYLNFNRNEF